MMWGRGLWQTVGLGAARVWRGLAGGSAPPSPFVRCVDLTLSVPRTVDLTLSTPRMVDLSVSVPRTVALTLEFCS